MLQKYSILGILLALITVGAIGQNYNNNPYTRFAIGDLINYGMTYNRSLGGSSIALRPSNQVNYLNPASYSAQDTLSFLFHTGLSGRLSYLSTNEAQDISRNMNIEYLAIGFPVTRWLKMSAGLVPFSRTQYTFNDFQEEEVAIAYKGRGGFNTFYMGAALKPFKIASIGFNAGYLFGELYRERSIDIPGQIVAKTTINERFIASDFIFNLGLQVHPEFKTASGRTHKFVLGVILDVERNINIRNITETQRLFPTNYVSAGIQPLIDIFNMDTIPLILKLPLKYGLGISYSYDNRISITAEYSTQKFSNGIELFDDIALKDYQSYRFGIDYIPSPMTDRSRARYFQRIHYRAGAYFTNTYLSFNGHQVNDAGISAGVGLPWRNTQKLYTNTAFNFTYEFGRRGTQDFGLIREYYHRFTLGVTLFDYWFLKPKYD